MSSATRKKPSPNEGDMKWWQLALTGVGCTIGTGYFLGSSIGISLTGPSIVLSFLLAATGTYIVFNLLAKMSAKDPQEGSFCYYAEKAYGKWAGFSCGWNYWCSSILIMGSQLIALSILTRLWFPDLPLWVFAAIYSLLSISVILLGTKGFDKVEDLFAIIKTAAIFMFIVLAIIALIGWIPGGPDEKPGLPDSADKFFTEGFRGFWASLIYAFYAFGGIEVIGLMTIRLKNKEDAPKAGKIMLSLLTFIYILSLGLAVAMVSVGAFDQKESPFVTALADYKLAFFPHVFNGAIIIAGFSTMTAALFGVVTLLVTLAKDEDAPKVFSKKIKRWKELPLPSLLLATGGLSVSVITALLLPEKIYEYITTAAGILLLYNWAFIIISSLKVLEKPRLLQKAVSIIGLVLIAAAVSGTLMEKSVRPGFWISLLLIAVIGAITVWMNRRWNKKKEA
ncbi:amino acid/polyamine/organocation transporter, APC superfamily [Gracilibacillus ureilyticus]|uniref:Amino acid/polyamine/organocation transporter, APC superfamily n=1 Tax=Gracilibacillus ureilyticus TaxID=531814 RepID=A0A1H9QND6_9BACI|nr:amino acid permease [Gracilibacillus ureilyticus]SER61715.1 amino acid/polyamine/organocation transporter, APC superfamily [Gracilibacillus ureilyticus]